MTKTTPTTIAHDCANVRQGDVVGLPFLVLPSDTAEGFERIQTPRGVVLLSQTCDIIQPTKARCVVAPVISADAQMMSAAAKGRSPLLFYAEVIDGLPVVADMQQIVSVPKTLLIGRVMRARTVADVSSREAADLADRIGRAFTRFAFPNEVYGALRKLRQEAQHKSGTDSPFGRVLDYVDELRVSSDQWSAPGRHLTLWVVVDQEYLLPLDYADPAWQWDQQHIAGLKAGERADGMTLNRACELLLGSLGTGQAAAPALWERFSQLLQAQLLEPYLDHEVASFDVELVSDADMTYQEYKTTASLDLEVLSDVQARR